MIFLDNLLGRPRHRAALQRLTGFSGISGVGMRLVPHPVNRFGQQGRRKMETAVAGDLLKRWRKKGIFVCQNTQSWAYQRKPDFIQPVSRVNDQYFCNRLEIFVSRTTFD